MRPRQPAWPASRRCRRRGSGSVVAHLAGVRELTPAVSTPMPPWQPPDGVPDLADVVGQASARRALEIAVAGRHNLALLRSARGRQDPAAALRGGPSAPARGRRGHRGQPHLSAAGLLDRRPPLIRQRPFRAPHHTMSIQGLVGGGPRVRPGEASLAHRGILFLDEALEFRTDALDALRAAAGGRRGHHRSGRGGADAAGPLHLVDGLQPVPVRLADLRLAALPLR